MIQKYIDGLYTYDQSYFNKEKRCGFEIAGLMKRAWAAEIKTLIEFDRICEKYNIRWFALFGTLLGAVRHKGFIPWDDDIDICMLRLDYEKFFSIYKNELRDDYYFMHPFAENKKFRSNIPKFINTMSFNFSKEFLDEFYGCPYLCCIDIFPLDGVPEDIEEWELQKKLTYFISLFEEGYNDMSPEEVAHNIDEIENMCGFKLKEGQDIRRQLAILLDAIYRNVSIEETSLITSVSQEVAGYLESPFQKKWFDDAVYLDFEHIMIPAPYEYGKVLEAIYGSDYMIPKHVGGMHMYPFYKNQKSIIKIDSCNEPGSEEREEKVADFFELDVNEVLEYKLVEGKDNKRKYMYFCQKEMKELIFNDINEIIEVC